MSVSSSNIMSKWYGDAQKLVRAIFSLACKLQPCIIFVGKLQNYASLGHEVMINFFPIPTCRIQFQVDGPERQMQVSSFACNFQVPMGLTPLMLCDDQCVPDEVDAFLMARGGSSEHEATLGIKTEFMQCWEGVSTDSSAKIMVMGATNRRFSLDAAVLRRFTMQQEVSGNWLGMCELTTLA